MSVWACHQGQMLAMSRFRRVIRLFLALTAVTARVRLDAQSSDVGQPESVLFDSLPVVEAATLHSQTLQEAPASITIISEEDIRTYGFRTFGEALASVRGFYMVNDRAYQYAGLRGFSIPGDYTTRILVMLNGHYLTDNVYSSNGYFGQDFDLDMDLVKRIEVVRGPSSALYGSNGIFATINIVTKSPVESKFLRATAEAGSFGEKKAGISSAINLGHGANLLISGSVFNNSGQSLYFPEFNSPQTDFGWARGVDGERGYHTFANLVWRNWSFTAFLGAREKVVPTAFFGTIFDDRGNKILDARGFFEAAYSRDLSASRKIRWRSYYDQYRYRARYDYALTSASEESTIEDRRDLTNGDWVGSRLDYDFSIPRVGTLTVGAEANADIRALQQNYDVSPERIQYLSVDHPNLNAGVFAQQQWQVTPVWNAYLGIRFDDSKNGGGFVSPRAALIYQPSQRSAYKFLWGQAFRDPNQYEMYYADGITQLANTSLRPEHADTVEISGEHKLNERLSGLITVYQYWLGNLIQAVATDQGLLQYQNVARANARGIEGELSGKPYRWIETTASLAVQRATDGVTHAVLPNSPGWVAKFRSATPLLKDHLRAAAALQYLSARTTLAGAVVPSYWLTDLTFTTNRIHPDYDVQFGVRNLLNRAYYDPASAGLPEDQLLQNGRSIFLKLVWRTKE